MFHRLVKNHGFVDGNKRVAVHTMFIYLAVNYIFFDYSQEDAEKLVVGIADNSLTVDDVIEWIYDREHD
ncbi:MAG: type II toxin-antitoxin system death-on-curing family toxin [Anaerovibrio sp.]